MNEEIIFHRYEVCLVNDELIFLLKKVRNVHIISVLKPVLEVGRYEIEKISLRWIRFSEDNLAAKDFRSLRTDNLHAVYLLHVSKNGCQCLAVYQPFSHKMYVMDIDEVELIETFGVGERVQFVMDYSLLNCPCGFYRAVQRRSRCFKFEKCWFKNENQLCATEDRVVKKEIAYDVKLWEEAFYSEVGETTMQSYRAMHFRK